MIRNKPILCSPVATVASARYTVPIVVLSLIASGCTSYKRIGLQSPTPAAAFSHVKPGDTVRVTLRDRTRQTFTIASVSDVDLTSADGRLFVATDIVGLERRHYDVKKNVGLIIIGVAVTFFIGFVQAYGQVLGGWS